MSDPSARTLLLRIVRITSHVMIPVALAVPALADSPPNETVAHARYLMGSRCTIHAEGAGDGTGRAVAGALDRIAALERVMTTWDDEGELARLNERLAAGSGPFDVSPELAAALDTALAWAGRTAGRFDPTAGSGAGTSWRDVRVDRDAALVSASRPGVRLDLGAFGKGYAVDAAVVVLRAHGVERALIDFGGQVTAIGAPEGADGWPVAVSHPVERDRPERRVRLRDETLATSSNELRTAGDLEGAPAHVIDPVDGRAVRVRGSVSVIAGSATAADVLSTALFVAAGRDGGREPPDGVEMLWLEPDAAAGNRLVSRGTGRFAGVGRSRVVPASADARAHREPEGERAPGGSDDDGRIDEVERKVGVLAEEIERLRSGGVADEPGPRDEMERRRPAATKVYRIDGGLSFGGYGEWIYQNFDSRNDAGAVSGKTDEADFLRLVLYAGYKFDERFVFNSEIELEHGSTSGDGEVSVEFAYLDILVTPDVAVRTGMLLVPVGLVNEMHEPPTFLGARRPDVERAILPTTWREVGTGVTGSAGPVAFDAYVMTGLDGSGFSASSGLRGGRQKGSKASAEDLAVAARLRIADGPGLVAGVSGFHGGAGQGATVAGDVVDGDISVWDVHADWVSDFGLELRGLWARVKVDDAAQYSALTGETIGSRMSGWYAQAGYDVLSRRAGPHRLIPFARVEAYDTQERVPAALAGTVTGENDSEVLTLGLSWKPRENIAFKIDWQDHDNAAGTGVDQLNVAAGLYF